MKIKILVENVVVDNEATAVGDIVETNTKDTKYLLARGFAEEAKEKAPAKKVGRPKKAKDAD